MTMKVGNNIDGWCTRCKLVLAHTIETMVDGKVKRVHCNTCGGQHAHRARAPRPRTDGTRARGPAAPPVDPQKNQSKMYTALLRGRGPSAARPYVTSERFEVSELIAHATFGLGAVTAVRDN